jgi:predicted metal-binding membrane protein
MGQWYFGVPGGTSRMRVLVALVAASLVAWFFVVVRMQGMDDGPGTDLGSAEWYVGIWVTMMAAMMLPSIAPMTLLYSRLAGEESRRPGLDTTLFVTGYLVTWAAVGVVAYGAFELVRGLHLGLLDWDRGGPAVAGAAIVVAGIYQLTPLKQTCLRHCRTPLGWVSHHWRNGAIGALRMGAEHGAWCVGCCWALMLVLFAVGVMSITWMLVLAAVIFAEKVLPAGERVAQVVAVALIAAGIWVAVAPETVPGLTTPGSGMEMAG